MSFVCRLRLRSAQLHTSVIFAQRTVSSSSREFKVVLDNGTLYVPQPIAEGLGWKPDGEAQTGSVSLTLHGWKSQYFAITQTGTESDGHACRTVEDARNPEVREVLKLLKEYDAK